MRSDRSVPNMPTVVHTACRLPSPARCNVPHSKWSARFSYFLRTEVRFIPTVSCARTTSHVRCNLRWNKWSGDCYYGGVRSTQRYSEPQIPDDCLCNTILWQLSAAGCGLSSHAETRHRTDRQTSCRDSVLDDVQIKISYISSMISYFSVFVTSHYLT